MGGNARGGGDGRAAWWRALAWSAIGLGVLTKGPIALGLPLMVAIPYAIWRRRGRALVDPIALLLFAAIILPWAFAISREAPGFLRYALLTETAGRLTTSELGRTGPIWYFLLILPAAALPWSVVALAAWRAVRRSGGHHDGTVERWNDGTWPDRRIVFLLLWILVPLLFFTLSQSKRPQYVLPLIPAVGLLVAAVWHDARGRFPGVRPAAVFLGAVGLFFILGRNAIPGLVPASTAVAAAIPKTAVALGVVCLVSAAVAFAAAGRREIALIGLCLPVAAIPFASRDLMDAIGADRSAVEVARVLDDVAGAETQVIAVQAFPLSLPFYLRRTLIVSTADGSELTSNYLVRHFRAWAHRPGSPLRSLDWWREALIQCDHPRVFVVRADDRAARELLSEQLALLVETRKHAAYGPCGISGLASSPSVTPNRPPSS